MCGVCFGEHDFKAVLRGGFVVDMLVVSGMRSKSQLCFGWIVGVFAVKAVPNKDSLVVGTIV